MLRHELYSMIHVPRLKDENAAELFLGFRIGTVRSCDFALEQRTDSPAPVTPISPVRRHRGRTCSMYRSAAAAASSGLLPF